MTGRRRLAATATAFGAAVASGFSGFFGGRALQMRADLGDGMSWSAFSDATDAALALFVISGVAAAGFLYVLWTKPAEAQ